MDRYYIGHTGDSLGVRLRKHNSNHKGFTGKSNDWVVVYTEDYDNESPAYVRERAIKNRKSRNYIENLINPNR